jgi:hypothetical protein
MKVTLESNVKGLGILLSERVLAWQGQGPEFCPQHWKKKRKNRKKSKRKVMS